MRLRNKRGFFDIESFFYVIAILFAVSIFIVLLFYIWGQVSPNLETAINGAIPDNTTTYNITQTNEQVETGVTIFNVLFPFLIMGLFAFAMIMAFYTNSAPFFFFISLGILIVVIILGATFSNIFQQITLTTALQESGNELSIIQIFMRNFPIIALVLFALVTIILLSAGNKGAVTGL